MFPLIIFELFELPDSKIQKYPSASDVDALHPHQLSNMKLRYICRNEIITSRPKIIHQQCSISSIKVHQLFVCTPLRPIHKARSSVRIQVRNEREIVRVNGLRCIVGQNAIEYLEDVAAVQSPEDGSAIIVG